MIWRHLVEAEHGESAGFGYSSFCRRPRLLTLPVELVERIDQRHPEASADDLAA
jgi:hypothetical protein